MTRPNIPPLRRDPDALQDWFEEPVLRTGQVKILAPTWACRDALVRVEVTVKPETAGAVGNLYASVYRYFRSDTYGESKQDRVTLATAAQLNDAAAENTTFAAVFDARDVSSIVIDNTQTTITLVGVVVYWRVPPTPVNSYVPPKVC